MGLTSLLSVFADHPPCDPAVRVQLSRIERKLDAIMAVLEIELPPDGFDDVRELIAQKRTIEAIQVYRERTGASLAEAKAAVDSGL